MKSKYNLQLKITLAMLLLVVVCNSLFAVVIFIVNDQFEEKLLNTQISLEMENFIKNLETFGVIPFPQSASLQFYLDSHKEITPVPSVFARKPGIYHNISYAQRLYHLAVQDIENDRVYLARDITEIEAHERKLQLLLLGGTLLTPSIVLWLGIWLSRKIIMPVSKLAEHVNQLNPRQRNLRLSRDFNGYEVETIARAFDRYLEQMDEVVEREQSFSSAASHELRTPLSIITTSAELLHKDASLPGHLRSQVGKIHRAAQTMSSLVTAFLFLAREQYDLRKINSEVSVCALLQTLVDNHRHLVNEANVELTLSCRDEFTVQADESHLSIVLNNLLQNAIFHTQSGYIKLSVEGRRILIEDTGSGIAPEDLGNIFSRQYRGKRSSGHGLGLYIAKSICDRYQWKLALFSGLHKGTRAQIDFDDGP